MKDFSRYINPWLGKLLEKLHLDLEFEQGRGCYLYHNGRTYLDCVSAYGALPFGHNHPEIWAALEKVRSQGQPNFVQPSALPHAAALAQRLVELAPRGLDYVTFTNSGAEAVEAAIKLCRAATGRQIILSTRNSFHGKTLGALSATGNPSYQQPFHAPVEGFATIPFADSAALARYLEQHAADTAAFIVEPIQGEGGVVVPPSGYLTAVRELCTKHGVPLVVDEIQTGLGRTGTLFACEHEGVSPDVLLLAKALGGGLMPIGAVLSKASLYSEEYGLKHSSTFAGGALACQAGLAVLDLLTRNDGQLLRQVAERGAYLRTRLDQVCRPYQFARIRGKGLMLGLEINIDRASHPHSLLGVLAEQQLLTPLVASHLLHVQRVRVAPTLNGANVIRIQAPLVLSRDDADLLITAIEKTLPLLEHGDTAALIGHLLAPPLPLPTPRKRTPRRLPRPQTGQCQFAFLVHPLDGNSFAEFDASLARLSGHQMEQLLDQWQPEMEPFVISEAVITSRTGATAFCEFINIPRTARQLMQMGTEESLALVRKGVEMARDRGAQLVGLGAFTSVVSWGGMRLREVGVPLTTGNSYTVVTACQATVAALSRLNINPAQATAAVVGAAGSIGRCLALMLADSMASLVLLGNPAHPQRSRDKLARVAGEICRHLLNTAPASPIGRKITALPCPPATADLDQFIHFFLNHQDSLPLTIATDADRLLPAADVVMTATNSVSELVTPGNVKFGAVICDLSRPANVSREIKRRRPDVLVIDGGVVEIHGRPDLGWNFGFERGLGYACMAETMLLALEGHFEHTSLGSNLPLETMTMVRDLAEKHGFRVADLRSFDKPIKEKDWQRVIAARSRVNSRAEKS